MKDWEQYLTTNNTWVKNYTGWEHHSTVNKTLMKDYTEWEHNTDTAFKLQLSQSLTSGRYHSGQ